MWVLTRRPGLLSALCVLCMHGLCDICPYSGFNLVIFSAHSTSITVQLWCHPSPPKDPAGPPSHREPQCTSFPRLPLLGVWRSKCCDVWPRAPGFFRGHVSGAHPLQGMSLGLTPLLLLPLDILSRVFAPSWADVSSPVWAGTSAWAYGSRSQFVWLC